LKEKQIPLSEKMKLVWREAPIAGVIFTPGSSAEYRTGDWRVAKKPVIDQKKCIKCFMCWIFCPDVAIVRTEKGVSEDYDYCKGCAICAQECPVHAITMVDE
jgi:pyruvate ferredoxin oxidoreductase delta subunit